MNIHWTTYVARQTPKSGFSHFEGSKEEIIQMVKENFHESVQGYRDGVLLVPVNPEGFFSSTVILTENTPMKAEFSSRFKGETPRKRIWAKGGSKVPAVSVDIILYSSLVLAENGQNEFSPEDGNWEIISINAKMFHGEEPLHPDTLMHNHFGSDGGTDTKMTDAQFVVALRVSHEYWKDKCQLEPVKEDE